jgi:hypothetical protein
MTTKKDVSLVELNKSMFSSMKINNQEEILINTLITFFSNKDNMSIVIPIINSRSQLSLRAFDWFITNYAKKYKTSYTIKNNPDVESENFNVYRSYKTQLKSFSKKFFDPFCRGDRIPLFIDDENVIITTIGQLNFFKWAITYKIIDHVEIYLSYIENDMNKCNKIGKKKKKIMKISDLNTTESPFQSSHQSSNMSTITSTSSKSNNIMVVFE